MTEELLDVDEVKRIATEYVRQKENVSDVEVQSIEFSSIEGVLVHKVRGKARKQSVDPATWQAGVVEELPFGLQISDKARKVIGYWREVYSPPPPSPSWQPVEPIEPLSPRDNLFDSLGKMAKADKDKAKAHYYEEKAKEIRDKRSDDLSGLARKYGIDPSRFGKR